MTPEEIVERAAEVLADHVWQAALGGCTPTCGWHGPENETEQAAHARHQVDVLAAANLLPTGGMQRGRRDPEDGVVVQNPYIPVRFQPVVRYCTPWQEEVR